MATDPHPRTCNYNGNTGDDDEERDCYREADLKAIFDGLDEWKKLLEMMKIFDHLSDEDLENIADYLVKVEFNHGEEVVVDGKMERNFYIIDHGCAIVYQNRRSDGVRSEVGRLSRGSYFGAIALFFNVPNAGTVVAEGHLKCARLNADRFERLVKPVLYFLKEKADAYKSFDDLIV